MRSEFAHKKQLAIAVAKGKRVVLQEILDSASGGGSWRRVIITRISLLDKEIKELEGRNVKLQESNNEKV